MEINLELKTLVSGLLKKEQKVKEINKYLYEIILRWHNPDEIIHRDTISHLRSLKDFFEEIICIENDKSEMMQSLKYLYSICEIENYIEALHDIMLCYLEYSNEIGFEELEEYFCNYKFIRNFLKDLKLLEIEYNKQRVLAITN